MAVKDEVTAREVGHRYAELVCDEPIAQRLWVSTRRDRTELWLVIEPSGIEPHLRFHEATASLLDSFPGAYIELHVLNPRHYTRFDVVEELPPGAQEIPLRPS